MNEDLKFILTATAIILAGVMLALAIKVIFFPIHVAEKSVDMSYGVIDETLTAENAVYNEEIFDAN
jgi:hypothetical protein